MGIGPSTKETSLHHFEDPLLDVVTDDEDIDLTGVIIVGTPSKNEEKEFVANRLGNLVAAMRVDGTIISTDGWGNSHIDFANAIEEVGKRGIPSVGLSFVGTQAEFVVTNDYMDSIIDYNKSEQGVETEVVGDNTVTYIDAKKAVAALKLKMKKEGQN